MSGRRAAGVLEELARALDPDRVVVDRETLADYGKDESDLGVYPPDVLVFALSAAEVSAVLDIARRHRLPVTPVGARSGKSGGSLPIHGGIALSLERMNRILEISPEDLVARVEPGVITGRLQEEVEKLGLFYPPDPNSLEMCTIGGNVAENAGGPRALKYGVTREWVLGLEVVLPTGEIVRTGHRSIKGVAGYDLTALFVGSEGTLGVVTEIMLKLIPRPREVATALVLFRSVADGARAVNRILASGLLPRCLELLDDVSLAACAKTAPYKFPADAAAALILEADGNDADAVFAEVVRAAEAVGELAAGDPVVAQSEAQRRDVWQTRRYLSVNLRTLHPLKLSEDVAVPRSAIPEMVVRAKEIGRRHGFDVATYGHAGDGNLHVNVLFDRADEKPKVDLAVAEVLRAAVDLRGTITGEHGVGLAKRDFLSYEQGPALIELQRRVKAVFDPDALLNPGKIFPRTLGGN